MTEPSHIERVLREQTAELDQPSATIDWRTPPIIELDLTTLWKDEDR